MAAASLSKKLMSTEIVKQLRVMMEGMGQQMSGGQARNSDFKMPEMFGEKEAQAKAAPQNGARCYLCLRPQDH
jgi:hypothetical protein